MKRKREGEDVGPDVKKRKKDVISKLKKAIENNCTNEMLKVLKENNSELYGTIAFERIILKKNLKMFENLINVPDLKYSKQSTLQELIARGTKEMMELFLKYTNINPTDRNSFGLKYSIFWDRKEILQLFINNIKERKLKVDYECLEDYISLLIKQKKKDYWSMKKRKLENLEEWLSCIVKEHWENL